MQKFRSSKGLVSLLFAVLIVLSLLGAEAFAADTQSYADIEGYKTPDGIISVSTVNNTGGGYYPFEMLNDGSLRSGNAQISNSLSVLKITVKGMGVLSFNYKVSSSDKMQENVSNPNAETSPDSMVFWLNEKKVDEVRKSVSGFTFDEDRFCGDTGWQTQAIEIKSNDESVLYIAYKKNGSLNAREDCVYIKNLSFTNGAVSVAVEASDQSCGSVTGSGEYKAGEKVTATAKPNADCSFYGWIVDGEFKNQQTDCSFIAAADTKLTALFGKTDAVLLQNSVSGSIYTSFSKAMSEARVGETLVLMTDAVLNESIAVPEGVTLYIPYDGSFDLDGEAYGTETDSMNFTSADNSFRTLTVNEGVRLNVKGTLRLGGVINYPVLAQYSYKHQGYTSGAYGRIVNMGEIFISSGAALDCRGFILGAGSVNAESGAEVYEPFVIMDFTTGLSVLSLYMQGQSPFSQYTMQNIRCELVINEGAKLIGHGTVYTPPHNTYNKADAVIIGTDKERGILTLKPGSFLTRSVDTTRSCKFEDVGLVSYDISGGASFDFLSLDVLGTDITTEDILLPIDWCAKYILKNGSYEVTNGVVMLPGSELTVAEDAELLVSGKLMITDGLRQGVFYGGACYPTTEQLTAAGFTANAVLTVNGTLRIASGASFGGIVQTESETAKIVIDESETTNLVNELTLGAKVSKYDNTSIMQVDARVMTDGRLTLLECGKTYCADTLESYTLDSYEMKSFVSNGEVFEHKTVPCKRTISGSFKEADAESFTVSYSWSGEGCTATAIYSSGRTCDFECTVAKEITKPASAGSEGLCTYIASVEIDGAECDSRGCENNPTEYTPKLGDGSGQSEVTGGFICRLIALIMSILSRFAFWK